MIFVPRPKNGIDADRFVTGTKWGSNFLFLPYFNKRLLFPPPPHPPFLEKKREREREKEREREIFRRKEETWEWNPQTNAKKRASHLVRFPLSNFKFFELSFQSSLQLALAVLVCYRSFVGIFSLGWNLPPILRLHSQATRLMEKIR